MPSAPRPLSATGGRAGARNPAFFSLGPFSFKSSVLGAFHLNPRTLGSFPPQADAPGRGILDFSNPFHRCTYGMGHNTSDISERVLA